MGLHHALSAFLAFALASAAPGYSASAQASTASASAEGLDEAILLGCLPALTGVTAASDDAGLKKSMAEAGFGKFQNGHPLLSVLAPAGSKAAYFGRDLKNGKVTIAIAQDQPFCTIVFSDLNNGNAYAEAASAHFEQDDVPFTFRREEPVPGAPLIKRIYDWQINDTQSIGANVMRATVELPQGRQFLMITMFVSTHE